MKSPRRRTPPRSQGRLAGRTEQVAAALEAVLAWRTPADAALRLWFRSHPALGGRDRAEVSDAVFDILRNLRLYRRHVEKAGMPALRGLAILGLASTLPGDSLNAALNEGERAWLETIRAVDVLDLPIALRYSVPDWLMARTVDLPQAGALFQAMNRPAPLDLRVNPMKITRDAMLERLLEGDARRHGPSATPFSPWGIRMQGRPALQRWPEFEQGLLEVQDEASQLIAALVAPRRGELVVDYCAGAGGKTLLLGALMRSTGRLYAFDVVAARLARAAPRFARSGLTNIVPMVINPDGDARVARLRAKAQRVLVDAPCSGLGTLRRSPDLKWRHTPEDLAGFQGEQARILQQAAQLVAPGGRLIYATCSILPEENQDIVHRFLGEHPEFRLLDARAVLADRCALPDLDGPMLVLRPDRHDTDGFFSAIMVRD